MNKFLIVANWKLNGNIKKISNFLKYLKLNISNYLDKNTVVIAPPTIYLERVNKSLKDTNIFLGSQNVDSNLEGSFTGETSVLMLKDVGLKYVIVGHSERRLLHNETDDAIIKKFHLVKKHNLIPILCVGETEKDKKNLNTKEVIKKQLECILKSLGPLSFQNTVIAYEPIWAIGTGLSADPKNVQSIHKFIKKYIARYDEDSAKNIIVQYGGSVNCINAKNFIEQPDINGLLIGGASTNDKEFLKIIKTSFDFY